jgi:cell division protein ZapA (FtsZ GTPase activity inhibitor)
VHSLVKPLMETISIKISIAGRTYPLTIPPKDEEKVRSAAKQFERFVMDLQNKYAIQDKQDLLAMAGLHMATKVETLNSDEDNQELENSLNALIQKVSSAL